MTRKLWGQMYDTCDPVSKDINIVLKHLTTEGKTKDGSDVDYMPYFDPSVSEKYLFEIYLPSEGDTDYSLWFDNDGLTEKMSGSPTCSVLPVLVKTTKDQEGQDVAIKTYYASFKLNIAKESNDTESDFKQILLNFLRSKMYALNGLIGENNEAYESDLIPFEGGKKETTSWITVDTNTSTEIITQESTPTSAVHHPASKDTYYKNSFIDESKNYKTFIKFKWQPKSVKDGQVIYVDGAGKYYSLPFNGRWDSLLRRAVPMNPTEGSAFGTTGALSQRVDEKEQSNESYFYVNSLGTKFFTRFAENARKIVSLDGTQIGNANIVLRPMMYVIE